MNVLVVNCGSSSIKYSLFDMADQDELEVLASGVVERIGEATSGLRHEAGGKAVRRDVAAPDHEAAFGLMVQALAEGPGAAVGSTGQIDAVGADLAPLHNPPNLTGIRAAMRLMPDVPHVAVFDTAFHQTMPPTAFLYAIPYDLYETHRVRRYGFHGTSHRYVALRAAEVLRRPADQVNLITAHLGNGCSVAAVRDGRSVDTSMGMTPLEGLVMGTRSGDLDPAVIFHLVRALGMSAGEADDLLNRRSGLLGVSGVSNDMREVTRAAEEGNERAQLALAIFCHRLRKYVGAYTAELGRVHALVFTGGIGENAAHVRQRTCEGLAPLGYVLDAGANAAAADGPRDVASADSPSRILVIPTDEEAMIARDTARIATEG